MKPRVYAGRQHIRAKKMLNEQGSLRVSIVATFVVATFRNRLGPPVRLLLHHI